MAQPAQLQALTGITSRFGAFVTERHPLALADALDAFDAVSRGRATFDAAAVNALRPLFRRELARLLEARPLPDGLPDTTPRTSARTRLMQAHAELLDACDGFLCRTAIELSLTPDERREIL